MKPVRGIDNLLERLEESSIIVSDGETDLLRGGESSAAESEDDEDEESDLDLSAGTLDKSNDPVRLYLREMGGTPLLNREGEVRIAQRIERGQLKTHKTISRSPIAVERLIEMGKELEQGKQIGRAHV